LVTLVPFAIGMSSWLYLIAAIILDAVFLAFAWQVWRHYSDEVARKSFRWSIYYLALLFAALLVDHYVPL
jgi:protoheme IX farnesyltransferase